MNVTDRISFDNHHSIEWGEATWDNGDFSIRNRYNKDDGGFNYAGSSELPWADFNEMILESIRRLHFTNEQIGNILSAIGETLSVGTGKILDNNNI